MAHNHQTACKSSLVAVNERCSQPLAYQVNDPLILPVALLPLVSLSPQWLEWKPRTRLVLIHFRLFFFSLSLDTTVSREVTSRSTSRGWLNDLYHRISCWRLYRVGLPVETQPPSAKWKRTIAWILFLISTYDFKYISFFWIVILRYLRKIIIIKPVCVTLTEANRCELPGLCREMISNSSLNSLSFWNESTVFCFWTIFFFDSINSHAILQYNSGAQPQIIRLFSFFLSLSSCL